MWPYNYGYALRIGAVKYDATIKIIKPTMTDMTALLKLNPPRNLPNRQPLVEPIIDEGHMDFPDFARHQKELKCNSKRGSSVLPFTHNAFVRGDFVVDLLLCYASTKVKRRKSCPA